jgi:hypothetical protein
MFRRLADGERGLAEEMFGAGLDTRRIRILSIPLWRRAFVLGGSLMIWPAASMRTDFGDVGVPLSLQATFVHELTHVWQAQRGVFLPWAKLRAGDSLASYAYNLDADPAFEGLNIEQQAMVVEHAFLASRGVAAQHPATTYANLRQPWRQA